MFIKKLEVENWKCFKNKKTFDFKNHMLISQKNGTGKTSMMEAIEYAIFGKAPVGFNLNTIRNDPNKKCRVAIYFTLNEHGNESNISIERVFGSTTASENICELRINDQLVCESVRTVFDYMDKILNQKITSQLWTNSLVTSEILNSKFFTKNILDDILSDPLNLSNEYNSRIYRKSREINGFKENVLDVEKIKKELNDLKIKLKENPKNVSINDARSAEKADIKLNEIKKEINYLENFENLPSLEDCRKFLKLYPYLDKYKENLKIEESKENNIYSKFSKREIENILNISEELGNCIICGKKFNEKHKIDTLKKLEKCGRSENKINELKENISFIEKNDKNIVEKIIEINNLQIVVNKCKNYKEIISSYDEENNKLWDRFSKVQKELTIAMKQQEELKRINNLKEEVEKDREKLNYLKDYIEKSSVYHTNSLLSKASKYLINMNSRYKQICLYEGNFHIVVENSETFACELLPVVRLSNGEKTMCALSLIFAMHNLLTPELPLLFDETFSALDVENLNQIKKFLRSQNQTQIFVITHDTTWTEF